MNPSPLNLATFQAIKPIVLTGKRIRLEPLLIEHVAALAAIGLDPELWRLQPKLIESQEGMCEYVEAALNDQQLGLSLPFVVIDRATEMIIGSTRFMDIATAHRRLEIGATWLTPSYQRTGANKEMKFLLLSHAFETLGVQRVVFKTEVLNESSINALKALGATAEGIFRQHLLAETGRARDMIYFSILRIEWAKVKAALIKKINQI
jgi:RimJ/RimL family protein N-acetyltransferase